MSVIDMRSQFDARRAENEAERTDMDRSTDRAMAVDGMVAKLRRKGHTTAEIARTLSVAANHFADTAAREAMASS